MIHTLQLVVVEELYRELVVALFSSFSPSYCTISSLVHLSKDPSHNAATTPLRATIFTPCTTSIKIGLEHFHYHTFSAAISKLLQHHVAVLHFLSQFSPSTSETDSDTLNSAKTVTCCAFTHTGSFGQHLLHLCSWN